MHVLNRSISTLISSLIFITTLLAQGPGIATNPNPPDSSEDVLWFYQPITWSNPQTAVSNKVLVGIHPDYLTELYSGVLIDSFVLPSPLEIRKTYYWRIDELDSTGITIGDVWLFTTKHTLIPVFIDSFSAGLNNWTANNENDSCGWKIKNLESSYYDLPPTAETYGVCADNYLCGNNRNVSILELANPPDLTGYTRCSIGWDNDLMLSGLSDSVYVEVSKNGGVSWSRVWERIGRNQRKSQEEIFLGFSWTWNLQVRVRCSLESNSSWWAIDNFYVNATSLAYFPQMPPSNLSYNLNVGDSLNVYLTWQPGEGPPSVDRFRIQRKLGDSLDQYAYFTIGETDLNTLSFLDNSIGEEIEYSYRVSLCEGPIQGLNSFPITLITEPVPVELISFSMTLDKNNVILNWLTATEINNYGFEILRFNPNIISEWEIIGFEAGHGTTTEKQSYSFTDESLQPGKYQYRLKQIDLDGTFELSQILEASISIPTEFLLEQNYPNPVNPTTTLRYIVPQVSLVKIKIYDLTGQEIALLIDGVKEPGIYEIKFNAKNLASGVYIYQMISGEFLATKKMSVVK
jgi:hypothetical protein